MELTKTIADVASFLADALTIGASSIVIYIFYTKSSEISNAFSALLSWSYQTTLSDLKGKLERLNDYSANEGSGLAEIRNILHEIAGQIRGNQRLQSASPDLANRIEKLANSKNLSETRKRSTVSEVREIIRNIHINSYSGVE